MATVFDYIFNLHGNYSSTIDGITEKTGQFSASVEGVDKTLHRFASRLATFDLVNTTIQNVSSGFQALGQGGVRLDSQMHDLSAVAGVTGNALKEIEGYARGSAKAFGTDAGVAVEGYKLLLSQLTPELAKSPKALKAMGDSIQTTSKLMGNDGTAAAEVLTTAMNQYGVSLADPMKASQEMARMMNVMAAAGQEGSAELPAIKAALEQSGMAAKAANVSFEETNAAIQVLDKAGKKGSEGGVALRNTLAILGQGRFLPKETQEALKAAGIDILKLGDNSLSLKSRLEMLKPVLNDSALFSKLFGMENANAARALVQGTGELGRLTAAVTGTKSAEEQAAIVMSSYEERQKRINQRIEDAKIAIFQMSGDTTLWISALTQLLVPFAQLMPLLQVCGQLMSGIGAMKWGAMWTGIVGALRNAVLSMTLMTSATALNNGISLGFIGNMGRAALQLVRFATVGVMQAVKGLGFLALSLVTGGTASASFSGIASAAFGAFKLSAVSACRAIGIAIMNIPIIGWVAAAIAALAALGIYFWNTSATFRAVLKGLWAAFKTFFTAIGQQALATFSALGELIKAAFKLDGDGITKALGRLKNTFSDFGKQIGQAFNNAYNEEISSNARTVQKKSKNANAAKNSNTPTSGLPAISAIAGGAINPTGNTLSKAKETSNSSSSGAVRNITVNIDKLVERLEVHTTTLSEGTEKVKEAIEQALLSAINDTNLAV